MKPMVWEEAGNVYYSASSLGACIRALTAARMGIKPMSTTNERSELVFAEGHLHEGALIASLAEQGITVTDSQLQVNLHIRDNIYVRGHIDGLINGAIFEAKSMSQNVYENWLRAGFDDFYRYALQITCYMVGLQREAQYYCKNRNTGQTHITHLTVPPLPISEVVNRIELIEEWAELDSFPFCDRPSFPCPFYHIHEPDNEPDQNEIPEALDDLLDSLSTEYDKASSLEKQAKARKDMAREKIANVLKEGTWEKRGWVTSAKMVESTKLDQRAAKKILEEAGKLDEAMKTSESLTVTVKPKKPSSDKPAPTGDMGPSPSSPKQHF